MKDFYNEHTDLALTLIVGTISIIVMWVYSYIACNGWLATVALAGTAIDVASMFVSDCWFMNIPLFADYYYEDL